MREIPISEFKATCIERLKEVAAGSDELLVTLRGKPLAKVTAIAAGTGRILGAQAGACLPATGDWSVLMESDLDDDWS